MACILKASALTISTPGNIGSPACPVGGLRAINWRSTTALWARGLRFRMVPTFDTQVSLNSHDFQCPISKLCTRISANLPAVGTQAKRRPPLPLRLVDVAAWLDVVLFIGLGFRRGLDQVGLGSDSLRGGCFGSSKLVWLLGCYCRSTAIVPGSLGPLSTQVGR